MPPFTRTMLDTFREPWAILPGALSDPRWLGAARAKALRVEHQAQLVGQGMEMHGGAMRMGSVSIVPIYGVIEYRCDWLLEYFGGTSVETIRESLMSELADPNVKAIVLDIDSPGGTVAGITEFAAEIRTMRGGAKPIVTVYDTLGASAACWIGSQADEAVVTPSGHVGSIGVYAIHQEVSRMLEGMGITTTIISAGPFKTEGNEYEPLTEAAKADLQDRVNVSYGTFLADEAAGRRLPLNSVEPKFGGGRVLDAKDALSAGLVDRIETLGQTVGRLNEAIAGSPRRIRAGSLLVDLSASAIRRHTTATDDGPWDGGQMEKNVPAEEGPLRASHAWVDDEGDPNAKGSYKFIHHLVDADGTVGAANMTACSTGIGYMNRAPGATGRPNIPDADRKGVHAHLAGHLADGGMEAPEMMGAAPFTERLVAIATEATELVDHARERARLRAKEGRPAFSTTTERSLRAIREAVDDLLEPADPEPSAVPAEPAEPAPAAEPVKPVVPAPAARRFRSDEEWLAYLQENQ